MPLATATTSRADGRSLAMALRTQNFVGHFLLPPVSRHEDMGRGRNIHNLMSRAGLRGHQMSALPPKADMCGAHTNVCFGPKADILLSIDYSICSRKYALGYSNSEALGFADVDNQFEIGRLLHR